MDEQGGAVERPEPVGDLDWDAARTRAFVARAAALYAELIERLPELPVARRLRPDAVAAALARDVGDEPADEDELIEYLRSALFDHSTYAGHPRFMGYVMGPGTIPGAIADLLAAGVNMNVAAWRLAPSGTEIELALIRWLARQFGLPASAGGLIVSGGAMANFVGLKLARDARAPWNVRGEGLQGRPRLTLYASEEVHVVSERAADMLGLGADALRRVPVDAGYRMRMDALRDAVASDRAAGMLPVAVVASAGTVATGAIDPLPEVADLCAAEGLWFHVDAAYGGPAVLADDLRPLFAGIERADSIAFDPHKWLYTPHSGGCVLVREFARQLESFAVLPSYVHEDKALTGHGLDLAAVGPQFSRSFWALKVWLSLLAHGRRAYARRISQDAALARYMGSRVEEHPELELAAPVALSICCFRFVPPDLPDSEQARAYVSRLNDRLVTEIQLDGRVYCSNALLEGRWCLRACIVNFRTEADDVDALLEVAVELGRRLDGELRPDELRGGRR